LGDPQPLRVLTILLALAFAVSVVHYTDNYLNYEDFPRAEGLPAPDASTVLASWFAFTAFGLGGYALFRRRYYRAAALCLGLYSGSGLVGIGHYAAGGMTAAVWWRQAHVVADIALALAILGFAIWTLLRAAATRRAPRPAGP